MEPSELRIIIDNAIQAHIDPLKQEMASLRQEIALQKQTIERHEQTISVMPQLLLDIAVMKNDVKSIRLDIDKMMGILEKNAERPMKRIELAIGSIIGAICTGLVGYFIFKK